MGKGVSFTGHRTAPYDFESAKGFEMKKRLQNAIKEAVLQGHNEFYTGMARGFDIISAEEVMREKEIAAPHIKLICIIPYKGQQLKWKNAWRKRYEDICNQADEVITLSEKYFPGSYHERNRELINKAEMVICFFSGKDGGTKHTVGLAKDKNIPCINIWED